MPPDLAEEFLERFRLPERFQLTDRGIDVIKYDPNDRILNRTDHEIEAR